MNRHILIILTLAKKTKWKLNIIKFLQATIFVTSSLSSLQYNFVFYQCFYAQHFNLQYSIEILCHDCTSWNYSSSHLTIRKIACLYFEALNLVNFKKLWFASMIMTSRKRHYFVNKIQTTNPLIDVFIKT